MSHVLILIIVLLIMYFRMKCDSNHLKFIAFIQELF